MILGLGIDSVEISRCSGWAEFSHERLSRLLVAQEIYYCLETSAKSAERFAARFAAKEAFFKAFTQMAPENDIPFLTLCQLVHVQSPEKGAPQLIVDWNTLAKKTEQSLQKAHCWLSITHTNACATVIVIIEQSKQIG